MMENFDWTSFTKRIAVKARMSEIYNAWTKSSELEKWFLERAGFLTAEKKAISKYINATAGVQYDWSWYLYPEALHGQYVIANGKDFIQFGFEAESLVDIKLSEVNGYTLVELKHHHIPTDDHSRQFVRLGCSNGWHFYLCNLKSIYEGGLDLRNKDKNLPPMLNN